MMASTSSFPSFTLADISAMPRRPMVSTDVLNSMRYVEVTNVTSPISGKEIARLMPGILEWRYLNPVLKTDFIALMGNAALARDAATRVNGHVNHNVALRATVSDRWPEPSYDLCDKLTHLKELRSVDDPNSAALYYALPRDSTIDSQRRLGAAFAAKNETIGVSSTRWVDSRDAF